MKRTLAQIAGTFATGALFTALAVCIDGDRSAALVLFALSTAAGIVSIGLLED